jgi:hypothetical protein
METQHWYTQSRTHSRSPRMVECDEEESVDGVEELKQTIWRWVLPFSFQPSSSHIYNEKGKNKRILSRVFVNSFYTFWAVFIFTSFVLYFFIPFSSLLFRVLPSSFVHLSPVSCCSSSCSCYSLISRLTAFRARWGKKLEKSLKFSANFHIFHLTHHHQLSCKFEDILAAQST